MPYPIMSANRPKAVAKKLRVLQESQGRPTSLGACLDLVSRAYGHKDWNALSASIALAGDVPPTPEVVTHARHRAVAVLAKAGFAETAASIVDEIGLFGRSGTDEDGTQKAQDIRIYRELAKVPFLKGPWPNDLDPAFAYLAGRGHDLWEFAALLRGSAVDALRAVDRKALRRDVLKGGRGFADAVWYNRMVRITNLACADSRVMRFEPELFGMLGMSLSTLASRDRGLAESIDALQAAHRLGGTMDHVMSFNAHETGFGLRQDAFHAVPADHLVQVGEPETAGLQPHSGLGLMLLAATEYKGPNVRESIEALNENLLRTFAFGEVFSMHFNRAVASMLGLDHLVKVTDVGGKYETGRVVAYLVPTSPATGNVGERERFLDVHGVHTRASLPVHLGIASGDLRFERVRLDPEEDESFGDSETSSYLQDIALCLPWIERLSPVEIRHSASLDKVAFLLELNAGYDPGINFRRPGSTWVPGFVRSKKASTDHVRP